MTRILGIVCVVMVATFSLSAQGQSAAENQLTALIRCDDIGMCHAVNTAFREVVASGLPVSASVMFACPWYQEAVKLLKEHPEVSVGIHLTLNAEWQNYRWGPVSGKEAVPSLVDSVGYFFPSRALLFAHEPKLQEVEHELRAQIERALGTGLRIDYVDYHMGAAVQTLPMRELVERLAKEYGLAISRYYGEQDVPGVYDAPIEHKLDTLLSVSEKITPDHINLFVFHVGEETPEMNALVDFNSFGPREMSKHRHAELNALISPAFRALMEKMGVKFVTYRDLNRTLGLDKMKRPDVTDM